MKGKQSRCHYVYELIDPTSGEVFYVGKGKGRRMYQHVADARAGRVNNAAKHERIQAIHATGRKVQYRFVQLGMSEQDAYQLERATIEKHGLHNLTNAAPGQDTTERKAQLHAQHLVSRLRPPGTWLYSKPPAERRMVFDVTLALIDQARNGTFHLSTAARENRAWRTKGGLIRVPPPCETNA